jgi:acetyl esterase/lipase
VRHPEPALSSGRRNPGIRARAPCAVNPKGTARDLRPRSRTGLRDGGPGRAGGRARGDWKALRQAGELGQAYLVTLVPRSSGVRAATFHATTADGASIELRWYTKPAEQAAAEPGPAVVYAHGGGMVLGTLDLYDELISWYVDRTGVPFLSVGYRRAPDEGTGTTLSQDVFAGLTWLLTTASELGVDPARVAVMGDSGGSSAPVPGLP